MKHCLIIFAKEPKKGKVKTRLQEYLTNLKCLNLYKAFLRDTLDLVKKVSCEYKILAYDSNDKTPTYLKKVAPNYMFYKQKGDDLGQRLYNAFRFANDNGASKIVIIGSDSPNLPPSSINEAFSLLGHCDLVLGPSLDGGYYLIGLKVTCFGLFKDIKWSSPTVFQETINRAKKLKLKVASLDKGYDIDDIKLLLRLQNDLSKLKNKNIARWTQKTLNSCNLECARGKIE
ncbi:MAG: TIGR04282 family arsenosugar biosynthesis glycosyltransferase [Candidatus Omnitrophota bacterium]